MSSGKWRSSCLGLNVLTDQNLWPLHSSAGLTVTYAEMQLLAEQRFSDSKVHGANMGPNWDRQDPGGSRVGPMNLAIWVHFVELNAILNDIAH